MANLTVEERLTELEAKVARMQSEKQINSRTNSTARRGWKAIIGTFADDPLYDEAMRLGREWRKNQYDETEAGAG